jgi:tetratricopeptide (TPR) repeat protein
VDAFCSRANIAFHKGDYDAAIAYANRAIAISTEDDWHYLVLARVGLAKKNYDMAWENVKLCRDNFGHPEPEFMKALQQASGRTE